MKIFGYIPSYKSDQSPILFYKGEGVLRPNYPLFLPEIEQSSIVAIPCLVLRIGRTGKFVDPSFAHRYIDGISVGYDVTALERWQEERRLGLPWERSKDFEGSSVVGNIVAFEPLSSYSIADSEGVVSASFSLDTLYQAISQFSYDRVIHTGDLLMLIAPDFYEPTSQGECYPLRIDEKHHLYSPQLPSVVCELRTK